MAKYIVLSPDEIPIMPCVYSSVKKAKEALKEWVKRYQEQGYYSTVIEGERVRIPYEEIELYCDIERTN